MAKGFAKYEDTVHRIGNSICFWKGEPYYVKVGVVDRSKDLVNLYCIKEQYHLPDRVDITSDDFVVAAPALGYMNYNKAAYYVKRIPNRGLKQGLSTEDIHSEPQLRGYNFPISTKEFYNCLMGIYPTYKEALTKVLTKENEGCAFDRSSCVKRMDKLVALYHNSIMIALWKGAKWEPLEDKTSMFFMKKLESKL